MTTTSTDVWVFGYGSLAWRPGFEHAEAVQGFIKGYKRVFWQGSTDHRGTPEAPGRTVTLHPEPAAVTWGVAYRLAGSPEQQQQTLQYLEHREKQYDKRVHAAVHTQDGHIAVADALVYLATDGPQNVNYAGPASLQDIAAQIATAVGPSGPNYEYVFRLADAMRQMGVDDAELFQLEAAVKQLLLPSTAQTVLQVACAASNQQSSVEQQQGSGVLLSEAAVDGGLNKPSSSSRGAVGEQPQESSSDKGSEQQLSLRTIQIRAVA